MQGVQVRFAFHHHVVAVHAPRCAPSVFVVIACLTTSIDASDPPRRRIARSQAVCGSDIWTCRSTDYGDQEKTRCYLEPTPSLVRAPRAFSVLKLILSQRSLARKNHQAQYPGQRAKVSPIVRKRHMCCPNRYRSYGAGV